MTSIQIIALVLIIISAIKLIVLSVKPVIWYSDRNPLVRYWMKPKNGVIISLAFGLLVLNYLLKELSITQIFAVTAFFALFFMIAFAPYAKDLYGWLVGEVNKDTHVIRRNLLSTLIWLGLMIWVLVDIFGK